MKISVILPVYNQSEKVLGYLKEKILPFFDRQDVIYDILIAADHSSSEQIAILEEGLKAFPAHVKLLPPEDIKGKGFAVQKAILSSSCDYDLFMDADLATDMAVFELMKKDFGKVDCFIASRDVKGSSYGRKQPFMRRLTHWGCRQVVRAKFHMKEIKDSQCGFKMFKDDYAKQIAKRQIVMGGAFDVEYLYFFHLNGLVIKEYPARWTDDPDSTIKNLSGEVKRFYKDLGRIKKNKENYLLKEDDHAD